MNNNMMNPPPSIANAANREINTLDEMLNLLPCGYKFLPDDDELIKYYLQPKIAGLPIIPGRIHDVDVYKYPPEVLDDTYKREGEQHTYFFTKRNRKYANGSRPDRAVGNFGFWKATAKDHPINSNGTTIGSKKTLVYYKGKPKGAVKTNWLMQEFKLNEKNLASSSTTPPSKLDDWVLCKIYEIKRGKASQDTEEVKGCENKNQDREQMIVSTEVIPTQQNQNFQIQHMQIPISSFPISESAIYPNSFPPPPPPPPTPPLPLLSEISFDDIMNDPFGAEDVGDDIAMILNFEQGNMDDIEFFRNVFPSQFPQNEPLP